MEIKDQYNRQFKTLRVSLTNVCNLACTYCVNEDTKLPKSEKTPLSLDQLVQVIGVLNEELNLTTIRLTGGEPTLYKNIVPLIKQLQPLQIPIKITTNGFLLKNLLSEIEEGEIDSINVSLDALDEDIFYQISKRRSVHKILEGIDLALEKGIKIKLNCVVINNLNDSQIIPLLEYARSKNVTIRFLELMKMGHIFESKSNDFYSQEKILEKIETHTPLFPVDRLASATSNYWQTKEDQLIGIIANESSPFCHDCDRLRLDSYGTIYGCISNETGIKIDQLIHDKHAINKKLQEALFQKKSVKFTGSKMSMIELGG